jgi:uncharacterized membrane protein YfcA
MGLLPAGFAFPMIDPIFVAVAVFAVLIVGLSKAGLLGGLGVVGVPLLALVMPARDAAGMMLPVLLCMDAVAVWMYRKEFDRNLLKIMLPGAPLARCSAGRSGLWSATPSCCSWSAS